MNKLEKIGAKIISQITIDSEFGWPPDCLGFIYQPERPARSNEAHDTPDEEQAHTHDK